MTLVLPIIATDENFNFALYFADNFTNIISYINYFTFE